MHNSVLVKILKKRKLLSLTLAELKSVSVNGICQIPKKEAGLSVRYVDER